jgi:hypothetical protein
MLPHYRTPPRRHAHLPAHRARPRRRWLETALILGWSLLVVGLVVWGGGLPLWG